MADGRYRVIFGEIVAGFSTGVGGAGWQGRELASFDNRILNTLGWRGGEIMSSWLAVMWGDTGGYIEIPAVQAVHPRRRGPEITADAPSESLPLSKKPKAIYVGDHKWLSVLSIIRLLNHCNQQFYKTMER
jgi:hypothetical protein